ncbi:hypothetical protein EWM64_g2889 [Hericium alpestre]|uniref:NADH:flavin oxidoreductase/NADH oxidase N-terminal domain-containing protein n=1 Tax=Hericium alpestre TaxID=135208 RepID=A0A4Z0A232_9AGAM|nr:hypothetical protein EWM64_g2889 [Hericium alpestre]
MSSTPKLFQPIQIGDVTLQHRVVMAPLTRYRANANHELEESAVKYYEQRASIPGTFLFTEGTFPSPELGGYPNVPGIWSQRQIEQWKKIVEAVHAKGSYIFLQLWALGRMAHADVLEAEGPYPAISAGNVQTDARHAHPRALTIPEIKDVIAKHAAAAKNAVHGAGFDGVEIHGAGGYLPDQFFQTATNNRTDEYGGSVEGRIRFALEVVDAVAKAVGANKTGIRISPWQAWQVGKRMDDPFATFGEFVRRLRAAHPDLGWLHVSQPRVEFTTDDPDVNEQASRPEDTNEPFIKLWAPKPIILNGGFTRESAIKAAEQDGVLVAFGRHYLANPDLPVRIQNGYPLNKYDRSTFYTHGPEAIKGYLDYPFYSDLKSKA